MVAGSIHSLYFTAFEASPLQATPGKRLAGIYVTGRDGQQLPFWRCLLRNLLRLLSIIPLFTGYLLVSFTPRRQALHDLLTSAVHLSGTMPAKVYAAQGRLRVEG
jgi:uncharacterized RDD family membrane protein YckC